jgi:hypothetical protein
MNFTRGAFLGMVAGTIVGVMNRNTILEAFNRGHKNFRRTKRRFIF